MKTLEIPAFSGIVTRFDMLKVREPLFVNYDTERLCIADAGFTWLQHFPSHANYVVSSIFDANGNLVQHYIDVILEQGLDDRGIPWFLDLYLDVIVTRSGQLILKDTHELESALETSEITKAQFDFAHVTALSLINRIEFGSFGLLELAIHHYSNLEF
jgi:uncharacterized protein